MCYLLVTVSVLSKSGTLVTTATKPLKRILQQVQDAPHPWMHLKNKRKELKWQESFGNLDPSIQSVQKVQVVAIQQAQLKF